MRRWMTNLFPQCSPILHARETHCRLPSRTPSSLLFRASNAAGSRAGSHPHILESMVHCCTVTPDLSLSPWNPNFLREYPRPMLMWPEVVVSKSLPTEPSADYINSQESSMIRMQIEIPADRAAYWGSSHHRIPPSLCHDKLKESAINNTLVLMLRPLHSVYWGLGHGVV